MGEQRYNAVMAVLGDGRTVTEVARGWEVSRQAVHAGLARHEREGMEEAEVGAAWRQGGLTRLSDHVSG